jgi:hypothetical protein
MPSIRPVVSRAAMLFGASLRRLPFGTTDSLMAVPAWSEHSRPSRKAAIVITAFAVAIASSISGQALACRGADLETTIFFSDIPVGVDAAAILQVTITELIKDPSKRSNFHRAGDESYSFTGVARVEKVIKGDIQSPTIKVVAPWSDCDHPLTIESHGVIIGKVEPDSEGIPIFFPIAESNLERQIRQRK